MSANYKSMSHRQLQEKYFYPVEGLQGVWVGTNQKIPRDKTPAQMLYDRETCVVYLVDGEGRLYMQPAEMFPKEILNAPLWKTIPLPNVDFHRLITPPSTPQYKPQSVQPHAYQRGYAPALATYTGNESPVWVETRHRRDSQVYSTAPSPRVAYVQTQPLAGYYSSQQPPVLAPAQPKTVRFA